MKWLIKSKEKERRESLFYYLLLRSYHSLEPEPFGWLSCDCGRMSLSTTWVRLGASHQQLGVILSLLARYCQPRRAQGSWGKESIRWGMVGKKPVDPSWLEIHRQWLQKSDGKTNFSLVFKRQRLTIWTGKLFEFVKSCTWKWNR